MSWEVREKFSLCRYIFFVKFTYNKEYFRLLFYFFRLKIKINVKNKKLICKDKKNILKHWIGVFAVIRYFRFVFQLR